jgi:regulator of ribonuclease activity A
MSFFHWRIAKKALQRIHYMPTSFQPEFSTCDFCDTHKNNVHQDFRVLPPVFRDFGGLKSFCGPVYTVQCLDDNTLVKQAVDSQGWIDTAAGRTAQVLVVDGAASLRRALLGGNLAAAAARNGWSGVLINGCVRDLLELEQEQIGIRALAAMPLATDKRNQGLVQLPVCIQGVWVCPGDWLYADQDGVVVSRAPLM